MACDNQPFGFESGVHKLRLVFAYWTKPSTKESWLKPSKNLMMGPGCWAVVAHCSWPVAPAATKNGSDAENKLSYGTNVSHFIERSGFTAINKYKCKLTDPLSSFSKCEIQKTLNLFTVGKLKKSTIFSQTHTKSWL